MKILVMGLGYIGTVLCEKLTQNPSYKVHGVDSFIWKHEATVLPLLNRPNFTVEKLDVREIRDLNYDVIIHLAALVGAPLCDTRPQEAKEVNYESIKRICKLASPNTKILYPNSNSAYGNVDGICTEDTPMVPLSLYASTKLEGEKVVVDRGDVSLRLATVFGVSPRMRMDLMVNNFVGRLYYDGQITLYEPHFKRNFVGINDVCRAFIHSIDDNIEGIYNVGLDSANKTKLEFAELVKSLVNPNGTITIGGGTDPDQRNYDVSSSKIKATGFQFRDELEPAILRVKEACRLIGYNIMNKKNY